MPTRNYRDYTPMGSLDRWKDIRYFSPTGTDDDFGDTINIDRTLILAVDDMREFAGKPFHVLCGMEPRPPLNKGWHPKGHALDGYFDNLHPLEMYEIAQRFDRFNGIGVYLWWTGYNGMITGGIHVDTRPIIYAKKFDARWGQATKGGAYVPVDIKFIREAAGMNFPREKEDT